MQDGIGVMPHCVASSSLDAAPRFFRLIFVPMGYRLQAIGYRLWLKTFDFLHPPYSIVINVTVISNSRTPQFSMIPPGFTLTAAIGKLRQKTTQLSRRCRKSDQTCTRSKLGRILLIFFLHVNKYLQLLWTTIPQTHSSRFV